MRLEILPFFYARSIHTTGIVASCEEYATSSLSLSNDMAGRWCTEDTILPNQKLLYSVRRANFGDQLHDLWVVEASIAANNQEAAIRALRDGEEYTGNERLAVIGLLKDGDFLSQT